MRLITTTLMLLLTLNVGYSQNDETVTFASAIKANLKKYNSQSDQAFERGDVDKASVLFDSLVQNHLVGSRFDDYALKSAKGKKVRLSKIKKPIFLITYSSWCVMNKGEIQALNKLAHKYEDNLQIVVLFWDIKMDARKAAGPFTSKIKVCYAHESYRNDEAIVATLKHTLGFPTSYYLNQNLEVVDIKRGGVVIPPKTPTMKAFELNYEVFDQRAVGFLDRQASIKPLYQTNTSRGRLAQNE
ncbi:redoxin domain-containing protein [Flavobacterium sp. CYK-55]|uniref:TlpA family protein disulfide reductase n=1 Tax=Flavobacterium sp. CYK-55 TaxID=2835529 RepID=UPI001BCDAF83|nr:redoxin domain-containing protein [Flavobacterium sp. CYK-55]MBS7787446.1 redoxin domain-containing protein [Flavobacterium sp. CYK-55]